MTFSILGARRRRRVGGSDTCVNKACFISIAAGISIFSYLCFISAIFLYTFYVLNIPPHFMTTKFGEEQLIDIIPIINLFDTLCWVSIYRHSSFSPKRPDWFATNAEETKVWSVSYEWLFERYYRHGWQLRLVNMDGRGTNTFEENTRYTWGEARGSGFPHNPHARRSIKACRLVTNVTPCDYPNKNDERIN